MAVIPETEMRNTVWEQIPANEIVAPENKEEISEIIAGAYRDRKTVLPIGGGNDLFTANNQFDIGIDLDSCANKRCLLSKSSNRYT